MLKTDSQQVADALHALLAKKLAHGVPPCPGVRALLPQGRAARRQRGWRLGRRLPVGRCCVQAQLVPQLPGDGFDAFGVFPVGLAAAQAKFLFDFLDGETIDTAIGEHGIGACGIAVGCWLGAQAFDAVQQDAPQVLRPGEPVASSPALPTSAARGWFCKKALSYRCINAVRTAC